MHEGYMENGTFHEFDSSVTSNVPTGTLRPDVTAPYRYLVYDFNGYHYASAYGTSSAVNDPTTGTQIAPLVKYDTSGWHYYTSSSESSSALSDGDHIYVIYEKDTSPSEGYVPSSSSSGGQTSTAGAPEVTKTVKNNEDGTYKITLSVTGQQTQTTETNRASVIVVFDRSDSMNNAISDDDTSVRLATAKTAVNELASTLLSKTDASGNHLVQMALISFSTTSTVDQTYTTDYDSFSSAVNSLTATGGTNWESALRRANIMQAASTAPTYVIFVTDGDPSVKITRGDLDDSAMDLNVHSTAITDDSPFRRYGYFGHGFLNDTNYTRCYDASTDEAASIVSHHKAFYTIGFSADVTRLTNLTTQAYGGTLPSGHNFTATDTASLTSAFNSIAGSITSSCGLSSKIDPLFRLELIHLDALH